MDVTPTPRTCSSDMRRFRAVSRSASLTSPGSLINVPVPRQKDSMNALQKLIRERMRELNMTFDDVGKRGGLSRTTVSTIVMKDSPRGTPRHDTLVKLARGLDLPVDVLRQAAAESAGYILEDVTTSLKGATTLRIIAAAHEKLEERDREFLAKVAEDLVRARTKDE